MTPVTGFPPSCGLPAVSPGAVTIDVHTHVFNATDLQVAPFITRVATSEIDPSFRSVIAALAPILQSAGWDFAPDGDEELRHLGALSDKARISGRRELELADAFATDRQLGNDRFARGFSGVLSTPDGERFLQAYQAYRLEVQLRTPAERRNAPAFTVDLATLRTPEGLAAFVEAEQSFAEKKVFTFVRNFFHYRYINALYLLENYGCVNGKVGVFACHMVDFDYGLGVENVKLPTDLDTQIEVMSRIHLMSQGRILPFVAFDPWRDHREHGAAFERVKNAVSAGKSLGVKLYPPMGFAPAENAKPPFPAGWPKDPDFPAGLDRSMNRLFDWCESEGVPVLAHANRSNAADPSFLDLGDPNRWRAALAEHPKLRVCFAHFGGDCLISKSDECSNWAEGFLEAFAEGPYAYADWSYFEHVLPDEDRSALLKRAAALFEKGGELARSRIVYGSDWLMLAIEAGAERYYRDFAELEDGLSKQFGGIAEQFFVKNAATYLGLLSGGATRARIEQTFSGRGRPAWLDAPQLR
jgi:predicted TIM-barrel fold metal-dependent hydrolase